MHKSSSPLNALVAMALMGCSPAILAEEFHHELVSTTATEHLPPGNIFIELTRDKHIFSTTEIANVHFDAKDKTVYGLSFINTENAEVKFLTDFNLNFSTHNVADVFGIEFIENNNVSFGKTFSLSVENQLSNPDTALSGTMTTVAMALNGTELTASQLPANMHLSASAQTMPGIDLDEMQTTALHLEENSTFNYQGSLHLSAINKNDLGTSLGHAAIIDIDSSLSIHSTGNTFIFGDIGVKGNGEVHLNLSNASDRFTGNVYAMDGYNSSGLQNGLIDITIGNGATWHPTKDNGFESFHWNKGGVLDITLTDHIVRLGLPIHADNHQPSTTYIEDGAVLRVRITDENSSPTIVDGKEVYLVNIENAHAKQDDNVQIIVQVIDERSDKETRAPLAIPLLHYDKNTGGVTLKSDITEYETALGKFQSLSEFGSGFSGGFVISDIRTDLISPSSLANNQLDTISTELVAVEKVTTRIQSHLIERALPGHKRGLWVDQTYSQTDLSFENDAREQELKINALTMGYDKDVTLPLMHDTYAGLLAYYSQGDVKFDTGNADVDQYGFGLYAGGLSTERKYRLILQAHWGEANTDLTSQAFLVNGVAQKHLAFNSKTQSYGAGLYMGFVQPQDEPSAWFIEPFISGYTYWMDDRKTNQKEGIEFDAEKNHQSVVKLGTTLSYQSQTTPGNTLFSQVAWAHRFGKSIEMIGRENTQTQSFKTEDLQESWGELTLGGTWMFSKHGQVQFRGSAGYSKTVKPRYETSISLNYAFD